MEEKKGKVVSLNEDNQTETQEEVTAPTREELLDICGRQQAFIENLQEQIRLYKEDTFFRRMNYLFRVLEYSKLFSDAFVEECVEEITEAIRPPRENVENQGNQKEG